MARVGALRRPDIGSAMSRLKIVRLAADELFVRAHELATAAASACLRNLCHRPTRSLSARHGFVKISVRNENLQRIKSDRASV
jgi:hypothetical protein